METVADFRRTLEQETRSLTSLCELWNTKLETDKRRISEEIEVSPGLGFQLRELTGSTDCRARSGVWSGRPGW